MEEDESTLFGKCYYKNGKGKKSNQRLEDKVAFDMRKDPSKQKKL